jgi:DNA-directed RNA polymerase specialized sigma24 family protein
MINFPYSDAELVKMLQEHAFAGPMWERFAETLAAAGLTILVPWIRHKKIFAVLRGKGIGCSGPVDLSEDDAMELAAESAARALAVFRDRHLVTGEWSPDGGASLRTSFINQCLHQFPNVYRHWKTTEYKRRSQYTREEDSSPQKAAAPIRGPDTGADPAITVTNQEWQKELLSQLPNDTIRAAVQYYMEGYTFKEAAEFLGVRPRYIENQLGRFRTELRLLGEQRRETGA